MSAFVSVPQFHTAANRSRIVVPVTKRQVSFPLLKRHSRQKKTLSYGLISKAISKEMPLHDLQKGFLKNDCLSETMVLSMSSTFLCEFYVYRLRQLVLIEFHHHDE